MSLVKCPECENDVSTEAEICPKCGFPIHRFFNLDEETKNNNQEKQTQKEVSAQQETKVIQIEHTSKRAKKTGCLGLLILGIGGLLTFSPYKKVSGIGIVIAVGGLVVIFISKIQAWRDNG